MNDNSILIIGAGASGLMAARLLAKAGKVVTVLEARNRLGGRIHTLHEEHFFKQVELGAEFVHGDLPVTLNLLNEAGIAYQHAGGEMWHHNNGKFDTEGGATPYWDEFMEGLNHLKEDTSIHDFLELHFSDDKHKNLCTWVERFASGYDTADPKKASAFALRKEWQSEDNGAQHRPVNGYGNMINYLADECKALGGQIYLNSPVKLVKWQKGKVQATTESGEIYEAKKILIALPLGVLQDNAGKGAIRFEPEIPDYRDALKAMGFGAIIKVLLEFDEIFWEDESITKLAGKSEKNMGFIISDQPLPTWWTQAPQRSPLLTGWLGGPPALEKKDATEEELLEISLVSLANIFQKDPRQLRNKLVAYQIASWTTDQYTLGSYAYDTVAAPAARKLLMQPVKDTLFFAGEYLYEGTAMGTVEAALHSGKQVAGNIIDKET